MTRLALLLLAAPALCVAYAYVIYPLLVAVVGALRGYRVHAADPAEWPFVSITVPVYNAAHAMRATLDRLLALDYPADRLEILVISDASTDGTDDIAREYEPRGVRLLRMPRRAGKTAAENAAVSVVRGDLMVNVDATVQVPSASLKPLIRAMLDPSVGVASGRDVSAADVAAATRIETNSSESGYVGYEMRVRALETRAGGIIGASGCFFAFRKVIHETKLPEDLSWDFASALVARELGYRTVSVDDAVCIVPRTRALGAERGRKARTMARGLATLLHKRALMNPFRYGGFAWKLFSHKMARWLPYPLVPVSLVGAVLLAVAHPLGWIALVAILAGAGLGWWGLRWPADRPAPRLVSLAGFTLTTLLAGLDAWQQVLRNRRTPIWEPTARLDAQPR